MLSKLFPQKNSTIVGLEFQADGLAIVAQKEKNGMPTVSKVAYLPYERGVPTKQILKTWVQNNDLAKVPCNVVLAHDSYQIMLVEPPEVTESELRNAIRWRLKDLLTMPVEQAAIDVFFLPEDGTRSKKRMVYVVAAESEKIKEVAELVNYSGLSLESIDIGELAIRNIISRLFCDDNSARGVAVARVRQGSGSVYIYRQGSMYLARTFSIDYNGGLMDDLPEDALALELQRSLDYYERQMGQAPPSVVYLCGDNVTEEKIGATFKASLASQVQLLDPGAVVWLDTGIDTEVVHQCLGALGGALRERVAH